jgi:hypothetical protein
MGAIWSNMVAPWLQNDCTMVAIWLHYGCNMVALGLHYGCNMVAIWLHQGKPTSTTTGTTTTGPCAICNKSNFPEKI